MASARKEHSKESLPLEPKFPYFSFRLTSEQRALFLPVLGMFVCYIGHDAFQEEMFRFEGFQFGWFMTLVEVFVMLLGAVFLEGVSFRQSEESNNGGGMFKTTWISTTIIGLCVTLSHGSANTALRFSSYPVKVSFKSCKLLPTMLIGFFLTGRRHSMIQYTAAFTMCVGLIFLSLADTDMQKVDSISATPFIGPVLLFFATSLDSIVPNLQERLFKQTNIRTADMIFFSNVAMFFFLILATWGSGELYTAAVFGQQHPYVLFVLTLQSICAYFGLRCYLTVVKKHGGVAGVLLANVRKIMTIFLSFLIFAKPCRQGHILGMVLIFIGVYLGLMTKRKTSNSSTEYDESSDEGQENANLDHQHSV
jgi:adenosine 3'-phospho 5'-phosphosulfate transporter B3